MILLQGCLFVAPAWEPPVNIGPNISVPANFSGGDPLVLLVVSDPTIIQVQANDPDDEILTFRWLVPRATEILGPYVTNFRTDADDWVSVLHLPEKYVQTGDTITCTVTDQAQPRRNSVEIRWVAEVL
jgi:hypothetical protein